jgi:anti-sigma B factor antagonist
MIDDRPRFTVETMHLSDERAVVAVIGEIDLLTAPQLDGALDAAIAAGASQIVVDLSDSDFIDSSGLSVLITAGKRLQGADGSFAVSCPSERVERILRMTGLHQVFAIHASRDEALDDPVAS